MTAAAARKRLTEPEDDPQESTKHPKGLWVDESLLPTNLAKRGPRQDRVGTPSPSAREEVLDQNRILRLADLMLGNPKGIPITERRKKRKKFKGVERRSTR